MGLPFQRSLEFGQWQDVLVGDLLLIESNDGFPADLLLLFVADGFESFISTANLDGETNLKELPCVISGQSYSPSPIVFQFPWVMFSNRFRNVLAVQTMTNKRNQFVLQQNIKQYKSVSNWDISTGVFRFDAYRVQRS